MNPGDLPTQLERSRPAWHTLQMKRDKLGVVVLGQVLEDVGLGYIAGISDSRDLADPVIRDRHHVTEQTECIGAGLADNADTAFSHLWILHERGQ